jgi:hypothetical protein
MVFEGDLLAALALLSNFPHNGTAPFSTANKSEFSQAILLPVEISIYEP